MDISLRIGALLAFVGMDLEASRVNYGQIWRQHVSETVGISTYRQTPSTLLEQHAHHGGFDGKTSYTAVYVNPSIIVTL